MKIPLDLHEEILARAAGGMSSRAIVAWLKADKSIHVGHVAVGNIIRKHRVERRDVVAHVVESHVEKTLGADLDVYSRRMRRFGRLYDTACARAKGNPTNANLEIVAKLAVQLRAFKADELKTLGVNVPDEVAKSIEDLLAQS